jgi:hypothetical protein
MLLFANADSLHFPLADASVHCIATSPPYWGQREYGTGKWMGGDPNCSHSPTDTPGRRGLASSTLQGGKKTTGHQKEGYLDVCKRCGARRVDLQIGREKIPDGEVSVKNRRDYIGLDLNLEYFTLARQRTHAVQQAAF